MAARNPRSARKKRGALRPLKGWLGGRVWDSAAARVRTVAVCCGCRADRRGFRCCLGVHVVGAGVEVRREQHDAAVEREGVDLDVEAGAVFMRERRRRCASTLYLSCHRRCRIRGRCTRRGAGCALPAPVSACCIVDSCCALGGMPVCAASVTRGRHALRIRGGNVQKCMPEAGAHRPRARSQHRDAALPAPLRTSQYVAVLAFVAVQLTPVCSHSASCLMTARGNASSLGQPSPRGTAETL